MIELYHTLQMLDFGIPFENVAPAFHRNPQKLRVLMLLTTQVQASKTVHNHCEFSLGNDLSLAVAREVQADVSYLAADPPRYSDAAPDPS
jgi:hypothetical protein